MKTIRNINGEPSRELDHLAELFIEQGLATLTSKKVWKRLVRNEHGKKRKRLK